MGVLFGERLVKLLAATLAGSFFVLVRRIDGFQIDHTTQVRLLDLEEDNILQELYENTLQLFQQEILDIRRKFNLEILVLPKRAPDPHCWVDRLFSYEKCCSLLLGGFELNVNTGIVVDPLIPRQGSPILILYHSL